MRKASLAPFHDLELCCRHRRCAGVSGIHPGTISAIIVNVTFGGIGMIATLAFLDLAARVCPTQAEGTSFALLTSIYNGGAQGSQIMGGWLSMPLAIAGSS